MGCRGSPRKATTDSADISFGRSESAPALLPYSSLSPKGRPSSPRTQFYLQPDAYSSLDRAPSPRPRTFDGAGSPHGRSPSPRPGPLRQQGSPTPFDFVARARSPRVSPLAEGPQAFFPERGPSPRIPTAAYDAPTAFGSPLLGPGVSAFAPPLRAQGEPGGRTWRVGVAQGPGPASAPPPPAPHILMGNLPADDLTLRRRPPKAWNESDLDVAYEKKSSQTASYEREWCEAKGVGDPERPPPDPNDSRLTGLDVFARPASPGLQLLPWRESSLDGLGAPGKVRGRRNLGRGLVGKGGVRASLPLLAAPAVSVPFPRLFLYPGFPPPP